MQPSWLSLEHGILRALIGCLYQAWAFRLLLCLVGFKTDKLGWGADSHMREDWGFPIIRDRHWHRTSAILSCWLAEIKVLWFTFLVDSREAGFFKVTEEYCSLDSEFRFSELLQYSGLVFQPFPLPQVCSLQSDVSQCNVAMQYCRVFQFYWVGSI